VSGVRARVLIAAGSNLEPERRLLQAARLLRARFPDIRFAPCYRNPAQGIAGPDFINTAASFSSELDVDGLRAELRRIEALCGRERGSEAGCALDLDLLLHGALVRSELLQRAYLLRPAAEVAPTLQHPLAQRTLAQLWQSLSASQPPLTRLTLDLNQVSADAP
jgi:2-amino-4-hydroxy-6-hydroxymethyldihydropteridine diphosphokinase